MIHHIIAKYLFISIFITTFAGDFVLLLNESAKIFRIRNDISLRFFDAA